MELVVGNSNVYTVMDVMTHSLICMSLHIVHPRTGA